MMREEMKTIFLILSIVFLAFVSQTSFADPAQKVCLVAKQEQYRDKPLALEPLRKHIDEQNCVKGDLLLLDYMDRSAAYVCDLEKPTFQMGNSSRVCTYVGAIRERRKEGL